MSENTIQVGGLTVEWLGHSTVGIYGRKVVYIDPFIEVLKGGERKADLVISTHGHRDHFDVDAINQVAGAATQIVIRTGCDKSSLKSKLVKELEINDGLTAGEAEVKGVPAYNTRRFRSPGVPFHPEGFGMGVVVMVEGIKFYYAGDTDFIDPMKTLKGENIDVAFLPIGGTYTMDVDEAVEAALAIEPRICIPVHYGHIKGTDADPAGFKKKVESQGKTQVRILSPKK